MPQSNPEKALQHTQRLLEKADLSNEQRAGTLLQLAECLSRLERFDEARQAATAAPADTSRQADISLMHGKIDLDEINAALERVATARTQKHTRSIERENRRGHAAIAAGTIAG